MLRGIIGIIVWLAVYGALGYGAYLFWFAPGQTTDRASQPRPETVWDIRVETVETRDFALTRRLNGKARFAQTHSLAFNSSGCLSFAKAGLTSGANVASGEVLARLDDSKAKLNLEAARQEEVLTTAQREEVMTSLLVAKTRNMRARNQVEITEAKLDRQRSLFDRGLLSQTAMEKLDQELVDVRNRADATAEEVAIAQSKVSALDARAVQAQIAIRRAAFELEGMELRAPVDGLVVQESISGATCVGAYVPLLEIGDAGEMVVEAEVSFLVVDRIAQDGPIVGKGVTFEPPFAQCDARISSAEGVAAARNMTLLRVDLDAACSARMRNNMAISFTLDAQSFANAVRLASSVEWDAGTVFVVQDGRLKQRKVTIAGRDENYLYITGGLEAGEKVLTSRPEFAIDGQLVRVIAQ